MNEAVKVAIQIQSDRLQDEAQAENEEFLKNLDDNIHKIIKEQVKEHDPFYFGEVLVSPEVGVAAVSSPARVPELITHSSSEADPLVSSLPLVSVAPMVLPFMCLDDSESDIEMPERHVSPTPHDVMITWWRGRAVSRSSSPTSSTLEIHTTPIPPAPSVLVALSTDIISHPCRALNVRKSVRPSHSHRLALRHTPPVTTIADLSTPSRFVYPPLAQTPQYSKAYRRWRSASLSTMYPPMTSELSAGDSSSESSAGPFYKRSGDSSSESSAGPFYKRCRSLTAIMNSSIHALRGFVPSRVDLLPPCKRFRDSLSPEDSVEEN
nr:hypothetical protein [Tanacetum cinerariifolium]